MKDMSKRNTSQLKKMGLPDTLFGLPVIVSEGSRMSRTRLPIKIIICIRLDSGTVRALDRIRTGMAIPPSRSALASMVLAEVVEAGRLPSSPPSWNGHRPSRKAHTSLVVPSAVLSGIDRLCAAARPRLSRGQVVSTALAAWVEKQGEE